MISRRLPMPPPRSLPWPLKPVTSAETSLDYDAHGRMVMSIRHDLLKGLTPAMVVWWFKSIGGEMEVGGQRLARYLVWHPLDHIHWELAAPSPDGGAGAGARFRIVEAFGRNPDFHIDVIDHIRRLDETGFTDVSYKMGLEVSSLSHDFTRVDDGTLYVSRLTIGVAVPIVARAVNAVIHRWIFSEAMGRAWLRHNVEEVGLLEHIVPSLVEQERRAGRAVP